MSKLQKTPALEAFGTTRKLGLRLNPRTALRNALSNVVQALRRAGAPPR